MVVHPDVLLYLLIESIRGDWSRGIPDRVYAILEVLPETNFIPKEELTKHMDNMMASWNVYHKTNDFDGRAWARDGDFCYFKLFEKYSTVEYLNSSNYLRWGTSDDGTKRLESNEREILACHEDVMDLYFRYRMRKDDL